MSPRSPVGRKRSHSTQRPIQDLSSFLYQRSGPASDSHLPMPVTSPTIQTSFVSQVRRSNTKIILPRADEEYLFPAQSPPPYGLFDLFPFSLLVQYLTKSGKEVKGKKAARLRAKMKNASLSHNLPLEISLYLVSAARF